MLGAFTVLLPRILTVTEPVVKNAAVAFTVCVPVGSPDRVYCPVEPVEADFVTEDTPALAMATPFVSTT